MCEWENAETYEKALTQGVAWFRLKAHQTEVIKPSNCRVFIRSKQASELLEVVLWGGLRSQVRSFLSFPCNKLSKVRASTLQTASTNIFFHIMLAGVYVCRYMYMSPITKKPSRVRVKRRPQICIFKHLDANPWNSAHVNFGEFENLIRIWILSIAHLYSSQVQCAHAF